MILITMMMILMIMILKMLITMMMMFMMMVMMMLMMMTVGNILREVQLWMDRIELDCSSVHGILSR